MTTIAGLLPLLLERSMQAQVLIPMATSLSFGLMFATALVLVLVPTFYLIYAKLTGEGNHYEPEAPVEHLPTLAEEPVAEPPPRRPREPMPAPVETPV